MQLKLIMLVQAAAEESEVKSQGLLDIIISGGPLSIGIVAIIFILSLVAITILFTRWFSITRAGIIDQNFMNNIRSNVTAGNIPAALALCQTTNSPIARMVEKGLLRIGKPLKDIDAAIENVGNLEIFKLEKNLSTLASIAGAAPMVGFLGTVTGMIMAFYEMSTAENVTPTLLAGGIYQALITTAFGLFVGIIAFVGYNWLVAKVEKVVYKMEASTMEFMDLLQEPSE